MGFKVERQTVRQWGADGPPANLRFVPERLFLWFELKSELRTVRRQISKLYQTGGVEHSLRTVRTWGADGPPGLNG